LESSFFTPFLLIIGIGVHIPAFAEKHHIIYLLDIRMALRMAFYFLGSYLFGKPLIDEFESS